jgi:uncharacterized phosphatase
MTDFIFVRHGQSKANAEKVIANAHSPLTEAGKEQARKTGSEVRDRGITLIVCSPYLRAQQTAEVIAGQLGIDLAHIQLMDDLRERGLGVLEGNPKTHDGLWYFTDETSKGIELRQALFDRMRGCLDKLKELSKNEHVLVAGHSISGFYLLQAAAGKAAIEECDSPALMSNADFIEVKLS